MELLSAESGFQFPGDMDDEPVRWKSSNCGFEEVIAGERERKSSSAFFFLTVMMAGIQMRMRQCVHCAAEAGRGKLVQALRGPFA